MNKTSLQLGWTCSFDTPEGWYSWNSFAHGSKDSNWQLIPIKGSVGAHTVKFREIRSQHSHTHLNKKIQKLAMQLITKKSFPPSASFPQKCEFRFKVTSWTSVTYIFQSIFNNSASRAGPTFRAANFLLLLAADHNKTTPTLLPLFKYTWSSFHLVERFSL